MSENCRIMIINTLQKLEEENNIKILFAIENGSRAWHMESANSDYDVRFVFYRPLTNYISLAPQNDVINAAFDDKLIPCTAHDSLLDMSGFDVLKFAKLLRKSNPTVIEWLFSDIVYYGQVPDELKDYATHNFIAEALFHHYRSMAVNQYQEMQRLQKFCGKTYLYTLRGLLNAFYVINYKKIPELDFIRTVEICRTELGETLYQKILKLIADKRLGLEKDGIGIQPEFEDFINRFLNRFEKISSDKQIDEITTLDSYIQSLLLG